MVVGSININHQNNPMDKIKENAILRHCELKGAIESMKSILAERVIKDYIEGKPFEEDVLIICSDIIELKYLLENAQT